MTNLNLDHSKPPLESIQGSIERVTFHSEQSGFCVLKVQTKAQRDLITVTGCIASIQAGEFIECTGYWHNDKQYGLQFKTDTIKMTQPTSIEGMQKYLASGLIKGIGAGFAKRLITKFGLDVFHIIEYDPEKLLSVPGLGVTRKDSIVQAWADQRLIREIIVFLQGYGVGGSRAFRIFKKYGAQAIPKMTDNPYCLAQDIHGIGFKTADEFAQKMGIAQDSILRACAGVVHCLQEITNEGHCGIAHTELLAYAKKVLNLEEALIEVAIQEEIKNNRIEWIIDNEQNFCFLKSLYLCEKGIARRCHQFLKNKAPWSTWSESKIKAAIEKIQLSTHLQLSPSQETALRAALKNNILIITGGPGVGKTTLMNSIIKVISLHTQKILLTAPTGRAAKRLSESTGLEAKTIHRLLAYSPLERQCKHHEDNPLEADLIVIDEASMIDVSLMHTLLKAIHPQTTVLLVGDVDQLPSVGPGAILHDLIGSQCIETVKLTQIFRQASTSKIIVNAHRVNQGLMPIVPPPEAALSDFYVIYGDSPEAISEKLIYLVSKRIPDRFKVNPIQDIQVLTPMRKGLLGSITLNMALQSELNPQSRVIEKFGNRYGLGDKVIQIINNYDKDVYNGDIGLITHLDLEDQILKITFNDREVGYEASELDELTLAYATTIHKSQGSEYPVVVIPLAMQHYTLLERNLIYTALTRGKSLVIIIAESKALYLGIKKASSKKRLTYLRQLMVGSA